MRQTLTGFNVPFQATLRASEVPCSRRSPSRRWPCSRSWRLRSRPGQLLSIKLEFIKPFASVATTRFDFTPQGGTTQVTWTMDGHNDFVGKAFSLVMNMDKMVGGDFERGLSQLKAVAEGEAVKPASAQAPAPSSR